MPKNNVTDLITDQEMAFARLILSGTMTDRRAAETAGLDPNSAAYIKSRPRVRAYMLEHRAAVEQQLIEQETQELRKSSLGRDRVLARLWEIANLDPEMTRNSASAQVKALSMIIAIEGLIPSGTTNDRRAVASQNQPAPPAVYPPFYVSAWARTQQNGETAGSEPSPDPAEEKARQEAVAEVQSAPGWTNDPPPPTPGPALDLDVSAVAGPSNSSQATLSHHPPMSAFVPDSRIAFSINKNRFGQRR